MRGLRSFFLAVIAVAGMFSATTAKASILLDPYLGYRFGTYSYGTSNAAGDNSLSGVAIGLRLAYEFPIIYVGVDYSTNLSGTAKNNNTSVDYTTSPLYVIVGANIPLARLYAGYAVSRDLTFKTTPVNFKYEGGTQFKVGVEFSLIPLLALNLEYINSTYDKVNGNSFSPSDKSSVFMIGASVPYTF